MAERIYPDHSPSAPTISRKDQENLQKSSGSRASAGLENGIPPYPQAADRDRRRRRNPGCRCLCCICSTLLVLIIAIAIVILVAYLVLRPIRAPKYSVQDVSISYLNVSLDSSPPLLNSNISFNVYTQNPNKKIGIYYDRILIYMYYSDLVVATSSIDPFYQGHLDQNILSSDLVSKDLQITSSLASNLTSDIKAGAVPFLISVKIKARIKIGALKSPRFKVRSNCNVKVRPPNSSLGAGLINKSCKLKVSL